MGYRRLLKDYISHVEAIVGVDLIDIAALTNALNKRDIGELRTVTAELKRESFMHGLSTDHNHTIKRLLDEGKLTYPDLKHLTGIEPASDPDDELTDERLERMIEVILSAQDNNK